MLSITDNLTIEESDIELTAIRASGNGGQNVNKVSSAIHLRFDIVGSNLPEKYKSRLLSSNDNRINKEGVLIIKAQNHRTQEKNREDALARLKDILLSATIEQKPRKATRPSFRAKMKRVDEKKRSGQTKKLRGKVDFD